jgi:signal transduction histidine kinase/CheY-like chemotaxis protein
VSPIRAVDDSVFFDIAVPIHARNDGESLTGWLVVTGRVRARGIDAVRQLADSATIIVGSLDGGVWTDLEHVVPGPPAGVAPDSIVVFDASPRGAGVGRATRIEGTPWVVWVQRDRATVLAPLNAFLIRVAPVALVLALLVFVVVWRVAHHTTHRVVELTARVDRMDADVSVIVDAQRGRPPTSVQTRAAALDTEPDITEDEIDRLARSFDAMFERASRERQLEEQLQQAQRLEAVGRLAGGVAHDFNNVLTVISNYGELLRADAPDGSQTAADLDQVLRATERASRLTRQLLAFSRRQILQPERLDLNAVVQEAHQMLRRLIPTSITIELDLAESLTPITADPVQVEQVLVNLAVNAADAMPLGGHLVFKTLRSELDHEGGTSGRDAQQYACLVVRDDGHGMDRTTVARIFEPFFTTKESGKGTGLGLATVHGIVTQLGGRIWVYSEVGKGTTFKVYLPLAEESAPAHRRSTPRPALRTMHAGQILLVEDDEATRGVTARILQDRGFVVRTAHDGAAALLALHSGPLPDIVVSDLMMPGVDGAELAAHIHRNWPHLPVVLMSGYADVELASAAVEAEVMLEKPFTARAILDAIAKALSNAEERAGK